MLKHPELSQECRGITYTCGPCLRGGALTLGANAVWNRDAFFKTIELCERLSVPLVFVHGSLQRFTRHTLSQLPGWAETMLLLVDDQTLQLQYQKMARFGMAMPLVWAFRAYGAATNTSGDALRAYAKATIERAGYAPIDDKPRPSDDWTKWAVEEEEDYDNASPALAASRFGSIAANMLCTLTNTVGDVSACIFDGPPAGEPQFLTIRIGDMKFDAGVLTGRIGAGRNTYVVGWADEAALLKAWDRVRTERLAAPPGALPIMEEQLKEEWKAYSEIMESLLETALAKYQIFPTGAEEQLRLALHNLKHGEMAKRCNDRLV